MRSDFNLSEVLDKPLMAHLASGSPDGPRDSPVWFLWENEAIWLIGSAADGFPTRLRREPRCAISVVDFDLEYGVLRHVGIRGLASIQSLNHDRLERLLRRYLGDNRDDWNEWFARTIVAPLDLMIQILPTSIVANDY